MQTMSITVGAWFISTLLALRHMLDEAIYVARILP
jgi:hypothetical protein